MDGRPGVALDIQARYPVAPEQERGRRTDQAAADDQDGDVLGLR
jgi:hypothetical protein